MKPTYRAMMERECNICGVSYMAVISDVKRGWGKCCSKSCTAVAGGRAAALKPKKCQKGPLNPNWKGGIATTELSAKRLYRKRFPEKVQAHTLVRDAVASGELIRQPCEVCGLEKAEAHHDDYDRPLDVRWLCRRHHLDHHKADRLAKKIAAKLLAASINPGLA